MRSLCIRATGTSTNTSRLPFGMRAHQNGEDCNEVAGQPGRENGGNCDIKYLSSSVQIYLQYL
ncbi:hypothetical protein CKAN_02788500 [Cinnamomum micranthum f. kanehirae]|uniref:Uncharacterized protein n=1 Tax=Cinnamomum micranthum f. kanehirae TaxID=337451 RepID=A0A443Q5T5_9MAGN|nr:hypothetical protein CKAN_02788500 [Cinnamomum micranthum f. kanehirae]